MDLQPYQTKCEQKSHPNPYDPSKLTSQVMRFSHLFLEFPGTVFSCFFSAQKNPQMMNEGTMGF